MTAFTTQKSMLSLLVVALLAATSQVAAFSPMMQPSTSTTASTTQLNIFGDALKGAFSNDDTLGKRKNEGLANGTFTQSYNMLGLRVRSPDRSSVTNLARFAWHLQLFTHWFSSPFRILCRRRLSSD